MAALVINADSQVFALVMPWQDYVLAESITRVKLSKSGNGLLFTTTSGELKAIAVAVKDRGNPELLQQLSGCMVGVFAEPTEGQADTVLYSTGDGWVEV